MGARESELKANINRLVWMVLFLGVAAVFVWKEIQSDGLTTPGWFLAAGLWSAICGVGYSVCDWLVQDKPIHKHAAEDDKPEE